MSCVVCLGCETRGLVLGDTAAEHADAGAEGGCGPCAVLALRGSQSTEQHPSATGGSVLDSCPDDQVVIGYRGTIGNPGTLVVTSLQTLCGELTTEGTSSGPIRIDPKGSLPVRGSAGTVAFDAVCPQDRVVTGFEGRSGGILDRVGFTCSALRLDAGVMAFSDSVALPVVGGEGGSAFRDDCPAGYLARGTLIQAGQWVDSFGLVCAEPFLRPTEPMAHGD